MNKDWRSIINLCVLLITYSFYVLYQYELFWGSWNAAIAKGMFYGLTALGMGYFEFDTLRGYDTILQYHIGRIYYLSIAVLFFIFAISMIGYLNRPVFLILLYIGLMMVVTLAILLNFIIYGNFKK